MSEVEIPPTSVIEHWVAWGPDDNHSVERLEQFRTWLEGVKAAVYAEATARAVHVLTKRYGASYEAVIDLLGDPNPYGGEE